MRYIIIGIYVLALFWLFLSFANFYINWMSLKKIEEEIMKKRIRIEVWKVEMQMIKNAK